jgi:hypothetical protein
VSLPLDEDLVTLIVVALLTAITIILSLFGLLPLLS